LPRLASASRRCPASRSAAAAASARARVDEAARFRLDVAPGAEQAEREARLQHHAAERSQPRCAAGTCSTTSPTPPAGTSSTSCGAAREVAHQDRRPVEGDAAVEIEAELRAVAGEHRLGAPGAHREAREVARGLHHAGDAHAGEQEGEAEAERERVVDRADEQDGERRAEQPAERVGTM
jgi:hypothetical protein